MLKCPECNKKYRAKDRYLMLKNINKEIICRNCESSYAVNKNIITVLFIISIIGYIALNRKISNVLESLELIYIFTELLKIIIGMSLMYGFIFISSFLLKGRKVIKEPLKTLT